MKSLAHTLVRLRAQLCNYEFNVLRDKCLKEMRFLVPSKTYWKLLLHVGAGELTVDALEAARSGESGRAATLVYGAFRLYQDGLIKKSTFTAAISQVLRTKSADPLRRLLGQPPRKPRKPELAKVRETRMEQGSVVLVCKKDSGKDVTVVADKGSLDALLAASAVLSGSRRWRRRVPTTVASHVIVRG